jgi:hypothetical protein
MAERRRYTKRQKLTAVVAADATSKLAAAEATGIPRSTLSYWMDKPEFVALRQNAREAMAKEAEVVARLAWQKLGQALVEGRLEPRDLIIAAGMATDKTQLLGGGATARVESRDLTDVFDDHETRAIVEGAREYLAGRATGEGAPVAEAPAVEGAGS